jgi:hypothetical protein
LYLFVTGPARFERSILTKVMFQTLAKICEKELVETYQLLLVALTGQVALSAHGITVCATFIVKIMSPHIMN